MFDRQVLSEEKIDGKVKVADSHVDTAVATCAAAGGNLAISRPFG
jgi:hypothetical protein